MSVPVVGGRPLVLAAHGTADPRGRAVVERVAAAAGDRLGVAAHVGYVDVCAPTLDETLAAAAGSFAPPVVVPFFLASGYHVRHDVPAATAAVPGAVTTPALGVEPEIVAALAGRVLEADPEADAVVLTAAGSSVEAARAEVARVAAHLAGRLHLPVGTAYLGGPGLRPADEVARLRAEGAERIVLAAHLLTPGVFLARARAVPGVAATRELGTHPRLVDLVVRRWRETRP